MASYKKALTIAANESYQSEVIDTEMVHCLIGEDNEYQSKEDWIEQRIECWISESNK